MKRRTLVSALPALVLGAHVQAQDAAAGRRYVGVSLNDLIQSVNEVVPGA
jgi:hypothetical protein